MFNSALQRLYFSNSRQLNIKNYGHNDTEEEIRLNYFNIKILYAYAHSKLVLKKKPNVSTQRKCFLVNLS